jgi:hypothetical protein
MALTAEYHCSDDKAKGLRHGEGEWVRVAVKGIWVKGARSAGEEGCVTRTGCMLGCRMGTSLLCPSAEPLDAWIDPTRSPSSLHEGAAAADWRVVCSLLCGRPQRMALRRRLSQSISPDRLLWWSRGCHCRLKRRPWRRRG